jgi:hypothetical protein
MEMEIYTKYILTFTKEEFDALTRLLGRTSMDTRRDYFNLTDRQSFLVSEMYEKMMANKDKYEEE